MKDLVIKLNGNVVESNFNDYKNEMLAEIKGHDKELVTDEDFSRAEEIVKICKTAEEKISAAKEEALKQTASIHKLFTEMNEANDEFRIPRLSLTNKIKPRKEAIKKERLEDANQHINKAIDGLLEWNSLPVYMWQPALIKKHQITTDILKNKRNLTAIDKVLKTAIDTATASVNKDIKAIAKNTELFNGLTEDYKFLFQNPKNVIALPEPDMVNAINTRIEQYKADQENKRLREELKKKEQEKAKQTEEAKKVEPAHEPKESKVIEPVLAPVIDMKPKDKDDDVESYVVTILIESDKDKAIAIATSIENYLSFHSEIKGINLTKKAAKKEAC